MLKRLETDRKALLDISLRNPLLSYRLSKARGVQVINEQSNIIYDQLVTGGKKLQFVDSGKGEEEDASELFELPEEELQKGYTDNKLKTGESAKNLQKRLLKTYYDTRTAATISKAEWLGDPQALLNKSAVVEKLTNYKDFVREIINN